MKYCVRCGCALWPDMEHWAEMEIRAGFALGMVGPLCLICLPKLGDVVVDQCRPAMHRRAEMPVHLL